MYHPIWLSDIELEDVDSSASDGPYQYRWFALIVICAALLIGQIDMTIVNMHESRTLASLRDTRLPKLLSGEIRVKDAEKLVVEAG